MEGYSVYKRGEEWNTKRLDARLGRLVRRVHKRALTNLPEGSRRVAVVARSAFTDAMGESATKHDRAGEGSAEHQGLISEVSTVASARTREGRHPHLLGSNGKAGCLRERSRVDRLIQCARAMYRGVTRGPLVVSCEAGT